jgi:hypothetical protein
VQSSNMFFSVLVLCTQVNNYDVCDVTLSVLMANATIIYWKSVLSCPVLFNCPVSTFTCSYDFVSTNRATADRSRNKPKLNYCIWI